MERRDLVNIIVFIMVALVITIILFINLLINKSHDSYTFMAYIVIMLYLTAALCMLLKVFECNILNNRTERNTTSEINHTISEVV
jgi:predicted membrane channel-forming protein YqfA (hemolysin III family)